MENGLKRLSPFQNLPQKFYTQWLQSQGLLLEAMSQESRSRLEYILTEAKAVRSIPIPIMEGLNLDFKMGNIKFVKQSTSSSGDGDVVTVE
jgi:hypothetical protein